jgi:thiamine-monophosphate kinase
MLVEGVHFLRDDVAPESIGHKALAVNLSDLAAMGARPRLATVTLGLPENIDAQWIRAFYTGMAQLAEKTGTAIVGGDLSRAPVITISITVIGEASPQRLALRSGAKINDILAVTGPLGASRAGLAILPKRANPETLSAVEQTALQTHLWPQARVREGRFLAASTALHAMMDLSDGLAIDARRLIAASGCGARLSKLPIAAEALALAAQHGATPEAWALGGGEDYELLVAIAPRSFKTLSHAFNVRFGHPLLPVGICTPDLALTIERDSGKIEEVSSSFGWDHFAK